MQANQFSLYLELFCCSHRLSLGTTQIVLDWRIMEVATTLRVLFSAALSAAITSGILLLLFRWHQEQMRQKAGDLLFLASIPRSQLSQMMLVMVGMFTAAVFLLHLIFSYPVTLGALPSLLGAIAAVVTVNFIGRSTEIRDRGILRFYVLLRWSQIRSYCWTGNDQQTLLLNLDESLDLIGRRQIRIRINPSDQASIEQILHQRLG